MALIRLITNNSLLFISLKVKFFLTFLEMLVTDKKKKGKKSFGFLSSAASPHHAATTAAATTSTTKAIKNARMSAPHLVNLLILLEDLGSLKIDL